MPCLYRGLGLARSSPSGLGWSFFSTEELGRASMCTFFTTHLLCTGHRRQGTSPWLGKQKNRARGSLRCRQLLLDYGLVMRRLALLHVSGDQNPVCSVNTSVSVGCRSSEMVVTDWLVVVARDVMLATAWPRRNCARVPKPRKSWPSPNLLGFSGVTERDQTAPP